MPAAAAADGRPYDERLVLAALVAANVAFAFQQTAVIPAIPTMQVDLHSSHAWTAWILSGYLIIASVATPLLGKLGDIAGKRRLLLVSLGLYLAGSVGSAVAPSIWVLIGFRALQGGGGAIFPLTLSMAREDLRGRRLAMGVGILTGAFGLGTSAGFGVSGLIVEAWSWRILFVCGGATIVAAMALVAALVPPSRLRTHGSLDVPGALMFTGGLALLLVGLTESAELGWLSPFVVAAFIAAVALLVGWVAYDLRIPAPLVDLHALVQRTVLLTNVATFLLGYVLFGVYFLLPFFVRSSGSSYGFSASPLAAGLILLPAALGQLVAGPLAGALERWLQPKWPFAAGMALAACATIGLAWWHDGAWQIGLLMLVMGFGVGLAIAVASTLVTHAAAESDTGIETSLNSVARRVGGGLGGQLAAVFLAAFATGAGRPTETGFAAAFLASGAVAGAGAVLAGAIRPSRRRAAAAAERDPGI